MTAGVTAPAPVSTLCEIRLIAIARNVIQPDRSAATPVRTVAETTARASRKHINVNVEFICNCYLFIMNTKNFTVYIAL